VALRLEFEIQVEDGSGLLLLRPKRLFGWLAVERLELQIPNVTFPLDITGGMAQFRAQRCRVLACALRVDGEGLTALLQARAAPLGAAGFSDLRARAHAGALELGGVARVGADEAELVVRVEPRFRGHVVELEVTEVHALGLLRRPSWLLAHDLLSVLAGASASEGEPLDDSAPLVVGLGRVRLQPLELFLSRALPAAGWKVPTADQVRQIAASIDETGAALEWKVDGAALPEPPPLAARASDSGDAALLKSDLAGAAAGYRAGGADERLMSVLAARESTLREALELAQGALERRPGWMPARLTLAAAEARGSPQAAGEEFAAALDTVENQSELSLRLARAAARRVSSRERAARLWERVLAQSPGDGEAAAALLAHYRHEGDWSRLATLLEAGVESASGPREQARALVSLSELYSAQLGDGSRARAALERAVSLDAENGTAWAALGRVRAAERDWAGAVQAFEKLVALQQGGPAEARTRAHLAALHEQLGDLDAAQWSWSRALALSPSEPELWVRAALVAERRGDAAGAAQAWSKLAALGPPAEEERLAEEALLRLALARGDLNEARRWRDGAHHAPLPESLLELARLEEAHGELDGALRTLGSAVERLSPDAAAGVELHRARLCVTLERSDDARAALKAAWRRAPRSAPGLVALAELAADARTIGDSAAEARWLDALLTGAPTPERELRRGELHAAAGEWAEARVRLAAAAAPSARRLYAEVLGHLGEHGERASVLESLAAEDPSLWIGVVDARLRADDLDGAEAALKRASAHRADDPLVREAAAELAWQRRAWDEVAALLPALIESGGGARHRVRLGLALERQGAAEAARAHYREAVALDDAEGEDVSTAWRRLAELEERAGNYQAAAEAFSQAAADGRTGDPAEARAEKHRRAAELLYRRLGRGADAVGSLEAALDEDPAHLPSLDLLEAIQTELGNDDALAATLRKRLLVLSGDARRRELVRRLAELESRRGDRHGALHAWQWVLEQDPRDPEAMRQLTDAALRARDAASGAKWAAAVPRSGLPDDERRTLLVQLADLIVDSHPDAAERALAEALALEPSDRATLVEKRVRVLLERLVDPVAALAAAKEALAREPNDPRMWSLVAETALAADEPATRAEALVRLLPTAPSTADWTNLVLEAAELYAARLSDTERAQALYEKVLDADPARLPAGALKLAIKRARGRSDEAALLSALRDVHGAGVDELMRLAQLHLAGGRQGEAAEVLADALDRHVAELSAQREPLDERGRSLLAELSAAAAAASDHASAARGLARAAEIEADPAAAASSLGEAALLVRTRLDDWPTAAMLLERALARRPSSALLMADFDAVMRRLDDPERLRRAWAAHLSTQTGAARAPSLTRLAQLCEHLGDSDAAAQYQVELLRWDPPRTTTLPPPTPPDSNRGRALYLAVSDGNAPSAPLPGLSGNELLAAIAALRKQVDALPARELELSRSLRLRLAWMHRRAGDVRSARLEFERLVTEDPNSRPLLQALVETSLLDESWSDAVAALDRLQKLIESPGERASLVYRMGEIHQLHLGDDERAAEEYLRALDLDPTARAPLWRLIDHFWSRGDDAGLIDIARSLVEQGALAAPQAEPATQARAWVALALDRDTLGRDTLGGAGRLTPPPSLAPAVAAALSELAAREKPPRALAKAKQRLS
jgi:lipopolysaccharide biosynthesis regulator YciM